MTIRHYLIGYHKSHGTVATEVLIPADRVKEAKRLLALYPDDPEALDPYELLFWQAREIAKFAGKQITGEAYDYFLQAFDEPEPQINQSPQLATP